MWQCAAGCNAMSTDMFVTFSFPAYDFDKIIIDCSDVYYAPCGYIHPVEMMKQNTSEPTFRDQEKSEQ